MMVLRLFLIFYHEKSLYFQYFFNMNLAAKFFILTKYLCDILLTIFQAYGLAFTPTDFGF